MLRYESFAPIFDYETNENQTALLRMRIQRRSAAYWNKIFRPLFFITCVALLVVWAPLEIVEERMGLSMTVTLTL